MTSRSKAWVCGLSSAEIVGSNPNGGMEVCCKCCMLSGIGLCVELIIRPARSECPYPLPYPCSSIVADFSLWDLLKGKVYKNTPRTIEQPKDVIRQEIQAVNADTSGKVFQNLKKRIQVCLDVKGGQFQHRL